MIKAVKKTEDREPVFEEDIVQPERVRVWKNEFKEVCITIDSQEFTNLTPRKTFPLTAKADYISFLNKDGRETVMLARPDELDPDSRTTLMHALERMYYVAEITKVYTISEKMGITTWQVNTDRGYAQFEIPDRENIRKLPGNRVMLTDADGNRFEIQNMNNLDKRSLGLVITEV